MRVGVYPADEWAPGWYRLRFPSEALQAHGYEVHCTDEMIAHGTFRTMNDGSIILESVKDIPDVDVIVVQRPVQPMLVLMLEYLKKHYNYKIVVDIDDDITSIHSNNKAKYAYIHMEKWWSRGIRLANVLTCSTQFLADKYGGIVLPNCVRDDYLKIDRDPDEVVGWTGTIAVHPHDLEVTRGGVAGFCKNIGMPFRLIGEGCGVAGQQLGFQKNPEETGWIDIHDYPEVVASLKLGIVPLQLTAFNQAKSWLKGMEYAALGVPFVASPTDEYLKLESMGVGVTAKERARDWTRALHLIHDEWGERRELGRQVAQAWTFGARAEQWWEAWTDG